MASGKWQKIAQFQYVVNSKITFISEKYLGCHPALVAGSVATNYDLALITRPRNKCGVTRSLSGFTLIELSIVLVIIGLLVGGVLVGRDLIKSAEIRSQISQIEQYNTAVNTFKIKYGGLPGDLLAKNANSFGFSVRSGYKGKGDGNALIEGSNDMGAGAALYVVQGCGETALFWNDLSYSKLINGNFIGSENCDYDIQGQEQIATYLPLVKIPNSFIYVYGIGSTNYFSISGINAIFSNSNMGDLDSFPSLSVKQAYDIDKKIDDGLPLAGKVQAYYVSYDKFPSSLITNHNASATTCFDNGNVGGATQQYSVGTNDGNGINCALSFEFQ